ncbi:MAG: hypothetical protein KTR32_02065 [Granulosicoccus sp.]|nr:hypothetical protein [Granulosicoccus sp.]
MRFQTIVVGAIFYTLVTSILSIVWHVVLPGQHHATLNLFTQDYALSAGLGIVFLQGLVLSFFYPYVKFPGRFIQRGLKFSLVVGLIYWVFTAPWILADTQSSVNIESMWWQSLFLCLQFSLFGIAIGTLYHQLTRK